jgi:hypothetical protein
MSASITSQKSKRKSAPAPANEWATKSTAEKVLAIIALQTFEGSWPGDNEEVTKIMGIARDVVVGKLGVEKGVWITALVVKWLEIKCAEEEGTWELVVEKARGWLQGLGLVDLEVWEREAGEVVEKMKVESEGGDDW